MSTVLVVDDHPVFRRGLVSLLTASGYEVIGEAAGEAEAVAFATARRPALVIMDLGLPDGSGITATEKLVARFPEMRIVVVTLFDDDGMVRRALAAGAIGYVVKDADPQEILVVVRSAELGLLTLGTGVHAAADARIAPTPSAADRHGLTPRERQIATLMSKGLSNSGIADRLGLAGKTVANNVSSILAKLGVPDRISATRVLREGDRSGDH